MKKWTVYTAPVILLALLVGCIFWLPATANAESVEGPYTYTVTNGEATITDCDLEISGDVVLPDRLGGFPVTTIGEYAFRDCTSLTAVTIPEGVTSIEMWAFGDCTSLTSITIPDSVTELGGSCFRQSGLKTLTIPGSVQTIDSCVAEGCSDLRKVVLEYGVQEIPLYGFSGCKSLTSVTIPESVTRICENAFSDCGLTSVYLPASVTDIEREAFASCPDLQEFRVAERNLRFSHDAQGLLFDKGQGALYICPGGYEGSYTVPESVWYLDDDAFAGCRKLTELNIGEQVQWICSGLCRGCLNLEAIHVAAESEYFTSDDRGVLYNKEMTSLLQAPGKLSGDYRIPNGVESIGQETFRGCTNMTKVSIPQGIDTVGYYVFSDCTALEEVVLPNSIRQIYQGAFNNCTSLKHITLQEGLRTIATHVFSNCSSLEEIVIPDSVTELGSAFPECSSLKKLVVGDGVKELDETLLSDVGGSLETLVVGDGVTAIPERFAWGASKLCTLTLGKNVKSIGELAFRDCDSLTTVMLGNKLESIGDDAFYDCDALISICLPAGLKEIGECAFYSCDALAEVKFSEGLEVIGEWAFDSCVSLKSVVLPDSLQTMGEHAFYWCLELETLYLGKGITEIPYNAFGCCKKLRTVTIPDQVTIIGDNAFKWCAALYVVYIGDSVQYIGEDAFKYNAGLEMVRLGSNVTEIETDLGSNSSLKSLTVPVSLKRMMGRIESDDIYYAGTQAQWDQIESNISYGNVCYEHIHAVSGEITTVQPQSCLELGIQTYTCVHGEEQYTLLPATGHSFTDYVSNGDATIYKDGTKTAKCDNCSETDTVTDPGSRLIPPGDMNGDMAVTDADAVYLLRYTLFPEQYPIGEAVDYTGDGMTTDADAVYLLRHTLFPKQYPLNT